MTSFFILAVLLVLLCLGWLLFGLFQSNANTTDQEAVNITLARERRATLDTALADGSIDQATFDYERQQLEYDLAADLREAQSDPAGKQGHVPAAVLVAVFIPIAAGALYLQLGNPAAILQDRTAQSTAQSTAQTAGADQNQAPAAMAELLPQLEERLTRSPDDVDGWRLLGRSYLSVNEFEKARIALEKALALDENDVPTLALTAEATAMTQNGLLAGEPVRYLQRAQALDADNEHTLWLLSIAQQQSGEHEAALAGFNRLAGLASDNPEALATIEQMRRQSLEALNRPADLPPTDTTAAQNDTVAAETAEAAAGSVTVTVSLGETAEKSVDPGQTVFIYAKATDGPPMPLAVHRLTVQELPATVVLDDSMAMIPTMKLSSFADITVGARVSTSGDAVAQSGEWFSEQVLDSVDNTANVALVVDEQMP